MLYTANPILIIAAVVPAVILLIQIYRADRLEKEPAGLLLSLVLLGIISTTIAMVLEQLGTSLLGLVLPANSLPYNIIMYFGIVAFSEEGSKFILLKKRTWHHSAFNCQFDGVVYAVFVSLGFALWENIGYVAIYGLGTALLRALTAVPGHACFGVFMGVWYGAAKRCDYMGDAAAAQKLRKRALIRSALLHGTYDFVATADSSLFGLVFFGFVIFMFIIALGTVKKAAKNDNFIDNEPQDPFF